MIWKSISFVFGIIVLGVGIIQSNWIRTFAGLGLLVYSGFIKEEAGK